MGSANNNIKRNSQMVAAMCAEFDDNLLGSIDGTDYHAFPSLDQMSTLSEERLFELGWGYRAPRFVALCAELQQRGGDEWLAGLREGKDGWEGARASLTELTGKLDALCLCAVSCQVK